MQKIVENTSIHLKKNEDDVKIKPRTIIESLLGGGIASIVGGILWGIFLIQTHRIMVILVIGQVLLSYALIRLFTKQSKNNNAVFVATILSVVLALIIGQIVFELFGHFEN